MTPSKHCVYCGDWFQCRDHVIPVSYSSVYRTFNIKETVPCCNTCNLLAGDSVHFSVSSKAEFLIKRYERKFKKVLSLPHWTQEEMDELDYSLAHFVLTRQHLRALIRAKLVNLNLAANGFTVEGLHSFADHKSAVKALNEIKP